MSGWQGFEELVQRIHHVLGSSEYEVERDVTLREPAGGSHQVDVLMRPKGSFAGPILISCKDWKEAVGVDHVREWADVVASTAAAAGVIVGRSGFTAGARELAREPRRRLSLWVPRRLTLDDFGPDARSPDGYIAEISGEIVAVEPIAVEDSFKLELRALGTPTGESLSYKFCEAERDSWYLRDADDNVVGNLWDDYLASARAVASSTEVLIEPSQPRFVVLSGHRLRFERLCFLVELREHRRSFRLSIAEHAIGYENVISGEVKIVPLPSPWLEMVGPKT